MRAARLVLLLLAIAMPAGVAHANPPIRDDLNVLNARIAASPSDVAALIDRSDLYLRDGQPDEALADLRVADALAPDDARVHAQRAAVMHALGRHDEALAELEASAAGRHSTSSTYLVRTRSLLRARVLVALDRSAEAVDEYDTALAIADDVDLYLERGRLLERLGRLDDAARGYAEGIAALGGAASLRRAAVELDLRTGRADRALATIDEAIARMPARARWRLLRADALEALGRSAEAARERSAALAEIDARLSRRPTAALRVERGEALLALGRIEEARVEADRAVALAPRLGSAIDLDVAVRAAGGGTR